MTKIEDLKVTVNVDQPKSVLERLDKIDNSVKDIILQIHYTGMPDKQANHYTSALTKIHEQINELRINLRVSTDKPKVDLQSHVDELNEKYFKERADKIDRAKINELMRNVGNSKPLHEQFPHYYKDVSDVDSIDVYAVCDLFDVDDNSGALQHAIKKLLVSGGRTGGKTKGEDIKEAYQTIGRYLKLKGIKL